MKPTYTGNKDYHINMTPFIDILLVLVVILLLTARTVAERSLHINLPRLTEGGQTNSPQPVVITIDQTQEIRLNDTPTNLKALPSDLGHYDPQHPIILKADAALPYAVVIDVIQVCHKSGFSKLALIGLHQSIASKTLK